MAINLPLKQTAPATKNTKVNNTSNVFGAINNAASIAKSNAKPMTINEKGVTPFGSSSGATAFGNNNTTSSPGGYGGYGYGSGGGGYNSGKAADNLEPLTKWSYDTVMGSKDNADKIYDNADEASKNLALAQTTQNKKKAASEWYSRQQKLQSTLAQLRDAGGNAWNGSAALDLMDMVNLVDDMGDVAVLNQQRENQDTINNSLFEALTSNMNARNENAMETWADLREIGGNYAADLNNIDPDKAGKVIDTENKTLKMPDWMKIPGFDEWFKKAGSPTQQGFYRPALASNAWSQDADLRSKSSSMNMSNAGNTSYFNRLMSGYDRRGRQS